MIAAMTVVLGLAQPARADIILTPGNNPQVDENVLLNSGPVGNPIFGETNQTHVAVQFGSNEDLTSPSSGQSRIEGADGDFTNLDVSIPGGSFTSLILNLNGNANGTVDFIGTDTDGDIFNFNNQTIGNGSNFFTFTTINGQRILSIALVADGLLEFSDARQFRIGGVQGPPTPEPASLLLIGTALGGLAWRRRRRASS